MTKYRPNYTQGWWTRQVDTISHREALTRGHVTHDGTLMATAVPEFKLELF